MRLSRSLAVTVLVLLAGVACTETEDTATPVDTTTPTQAAAVGFDELCAEIVEEVADLVDLRDELEGTDDLSEAADTIEANLEVIRARFDELVDSEATEDRANLEPVTQALSAAVDEIEEAFQATRDANFGDAQTALEQAGSHLSDARDAAADVDLIRCVSAGQEIEASPEASPGDDPDDGSDESPGASPEASPDGSEP